MFIAVELSNHKPTQLNPRNSASWEIKSHSARQLPFCLRNTKVYSYVHKSPPLDLFLSYTNPMHNFTDSFH